jgi:hypothetical protein
VRGVRVRRCKVCSGDVHPCGFSRFCILAVAGVGLLDGLGFASERSFLLFCFGAPTGTLDLFPHDVHVVTFTSAHGLLPPLLRFSIEVVDVVPGIRSISQCLQIECLTMEVRRIWDFKETDRRWERTRRVRGGA